MPVSEQPIVERIARVLLLFWKPTDGPNRYGPDPRLDPDDAVLASE